MTIHALCTSTATCSCPTGCAGSTPRGSTTGSRSPTPPFSKSDEAYLDLIHGMLGDAPATAGYYLAADNWTYSAPAITLVDKAMAILRRFHAEIEKQGVATTVKTQNCPNSG
ncbi:hypothetical protein D1007_20162 [Hordeum vulgare]|nr:hypothetical protein D1007_20162 [Hordeum vulgare]